MEERINPVISRLLWIVGERHAKVEQLSGVILGFQRMANDLAETDAERQAQIDDLKGTVVGEEAKIKDLEEILAVREANVEGLERILAERDGMIEDLEGKVGELEGKVEGLEGKVEGLEGKVEDLEGTLVERDKKVKEQEGAILGFQKHKITVNLQLNRAERILSFLQSSLISTVESFKRDVNLGQMGDALPNGSVQGGCP